MITSYASAPVIGVGWKVRYENDDPSQPAYGPFDPADPYAISQAATNYLHVYVGDANVASTPTSYDVFELDYAGGGFSPGKTWTSL